MLVFSFFEQGSRFQTIFPAENQPQNKTKLFGLQYFENVCKQKESKSIDSPKLAHFLTSYSFKIPRKNMPGLLGPFFLAVL